MCVSELFVVFFVVCVNTLCVEDNFRGNRSRLVWIDSTNVRRRLAKEIVTDNVRNDLNPFGN